MTVAPLRRRSGSPSGFDVDQVDPRRARRRRRARRHPHSARCWACSSTKATRHVVLDLAALAFIDAAGLGVIADDLGTPGDVGPGAHVACDARSDPADPRHHRRRRARSDSKRRIRTSPSLGAEQRSDDRSVAVVTERGRSLRRPRPGRHQAERRGDRRRAPSRHRAGRSDRRGRRRRQRHARTRRPPGDGGVEQRHRPADGRPPVRNRSGAVPRGGGRGPLVPQRVVGRRAPLAGVRPACHRGGHRQHPLDTTHDRRASRSARSTSTPTPTAPSDPASRSSRRCSRRRRRGS